ncbi:hypothetical protein BgAZ_200050 [Babesia gibsoni]|uniref:Uncharacterized protein n=1 Tax=Babesia gibsoni TaxID=33632 RepID=A0AAD8LJ18_BABGI|nr:hypothetical protein BgAZ_200050 [Babesia gibsoni]
MVSTGSDEKVMLSSGKTVTVSTESREKLSDDDEAPTIERVHNVWGSSSGARSDFFDHYTKTRSIEKARLEEMEKRWAIDMENKVFQTIRYNRMKREQEKMEKRRGKREKRKMKVRCKSMSEPSQGTLADNKSSSCGNSDKNGEVESPSSSVAVKKSRVQKQRETHQHSKEFAIPTDDIVNHTAAPSSLIIDEDIMNTY